MVAVAGAAVAWLGATLLCLSDGRRGLALGLGLVALGLAAAAAATGAGLPAASALAAGGLCSAAMRLRRGAPGWGVLPPASTPRLVTSMVVLVAAGLVGGSVPGSPRAASLLAALVVVLLACARLMAVHERSAALGCGAALALGLGALGGDVALVAGAVAAAGLGLIGGADALETSG